MCFNAHTSLLALVVSLVGAACVWRRGGRTDRFVAVLCVVIGLMQALELAMWLDQGCGDLNKIATALVPVVLMAQAVWLIGGSYLCGVSRLPPRLLQVWLLVTTGLLSADIGAHYTTGCSTAHPESGHLVWGGGISVIRPWFGVPYFAAHAVMLTLKDGAYGQAMFVALYATKWFAIAKGRTAWASGTWKSVWCIMASALMPAVALVTDAAAHAHPSLQKQGDNK